MGVGRAPRTDHEILAVLTQYDVPRLGDNDISGSPYFVQNQELQTCEFSNPKVLITDRKIQNMNELVPLLEGLIKTKVRPRPTRRAAAVRALGGVRRARRSLSHAPRLARTSSHAPPSDALPAPPPQDYLDLRGYPHAGGSRRAT